MKKSEIEHLSAVLWSRFSSAGGLPSSAVNRSFGLVRHEINQIIRKNFMLGIFDDESPKVTLVTTDPLSKN